MLIALPAALALVAVVALRGGESGWRRRLAIVAAVALSVRLAAVVVIYLIARQTHGEGVWLNDEASFFLATEALLPNPIDRALPGGLDHLGGDGYLGLMAFMAVLGGVADANVFRVTNAALGALVAVVTMLVATRLYGPRVGFSAGLLVAVWPTLVLWSATMLRDMLGAFVVVFVWWLLGRSRQLGPLRTGAGVLLALVLLGSLRPYLCLAVALGVLAWLAYPLVRRSSWRQLALMGCGALVILTMAAVTQARRIDFAVHELLYRQTVTRMETLGRLYTDDVPETASLPIRPGSAVAIVDHPDGWLLTGILQDFVAPDIVQVAFTDDTIRRIPLAEVILIQSAVIPPAQLVAGLGPDLLSFLAGTSSTTDNSSPAWVFDALAWDVILVAAVLGAARARLDLREYLLPLCVVGTTVLALVLIPGAPGNADRHRATQTLPFLFVLACGLVSARVAGRSPGLAVASTTSRPASAATADSSRTRSA